MKISQNFPAAYRRLKLRDFPRKVPTSQSWDRCIGIPRKICNEIMTMKILTISRPSLPETFFSDEVHLLTLLKMQNLEGLANWCSQEKSRRKRIVSKIWKTMSNWMVYRSSGSPKSHMMWTVAPWSERVRGSYSHVLEYYHDLLTGGIWAPNSHSSLRYSRDFILVKSSGNELLPRVEAQD